jgi:hypothetical protein
LAGQQRLKIAGPPRNALRIPLEETHIFFANPKVWNIEPEAPIKLFPGFVDGHNVAFTVERRSAHRQAMQCVKASSDFGPGRRAFRAGTMAHFGGSKSAR